MENIQMSAMFDDMLSSIASDAHENEAKVAAMRASLATLREKCTDADRTVSKASVAVLKDCGAESFRTACVNLGTEWAGLVAAMMAAEFINDRCLELDGLDEAERSALRMALIDEARYVLGRCGR